MSILKVIGLMNKYETLLNSLMNKNFKLTESCFDLVLGEKKLSCNSGFPYYPEVECSYDLK